MTERPKNKIKKIRELENEHEGRKDQNQKYKKTRRSESQNKRRLKTKKTR